MRQLLILSFIFVYLPLSWSQVTLTKSNLPIIVIDTKGQQINDEPKIIADMKVLYNGLHMENSVFDPPNEYNNKIGIEYRGSSSQGFPKKPYGLETLDANNEENEVSLIGMPKESDWILNAAYNDKSLMRDGLAYILAGQIMEYAPRVRYSELVVNNEYQGVYLLVEKIKRDKSRVNIEKIEETDNANDALTGGYIIKLDKDTGSNSGQGWFSLHKPYNGAWQNTYFQYEYPKASAITLQQKNYIQQFFNKAELSISLSNYKDPINGYRKYIDTASLVNYIIINELTKNPDAYRLSTFLYKDRDSKGGKIKFGPVWDFNLGFGNVDYCTQGNTEGLVIENFNTVCGNDFWVVHFWWKKFLEDKGLYDHLKRKWNTLRKKELSNERIQFTIDSLSTLLKEPQVRNFKKWPVLGQYIWPNYFIGKTYTEEVVHLKTWVQSRVNYLDKVWSIDSISTNPEVTLLSIRPNPTTQVVQLVVNRKIPKDIDIKIFDSKGSLYEVEYSFITDQLIEINLQTVPSGMLFLQVGLFGETHSHSLIKER